MWSWKDLYPQSSHQSGLKIVELTESNTCKFCDNALGKYTCPRCNLMYCSINCYQSEQHLECSETFYKENVLQNLEQEGDEEGKKKMMEILERFHESNKLHEEESLDEDDDDDDFETIDSDEFEDLEDIFTNIEDRLAGIDLDDSEEVWGKLNDNERKEFEAFLMSEDVGKFIPMWNPWWSYRCEKRCIEMTELDDQKAKCPKIQENIKPFSEITCKPPASCVENNLVNVIAAYVFILRYFNGDHADFPKETASFIFNLSLNLKKNQNFDTFNQAVLSVTAECMNDELSIMVDKENIEHVKTDVQMILSGPHATEKQYYLQCALSELLSLFESALKTGEMKAEGNFYKKFTENQSTTINTISDEDLTKCIKKIEYYLSFSKYCYNL